MLWNWDLRISESDSSYLASDSARSVSRRIWLGRYFEPCHHSFPPCCNAPSLTASPPLALPFKAPHGRRRLSHPQPLTHAKTTMVSQHGCHLHPPWPSFRAAGGETTCRETQKTGEENGEQLFLEQVKKTTKYATSPPFPNRPCFLFLKMETYI